MRPSEMSGKRNTQATDLRRGKEERERRGEE